jgi:hypothetical protein
VRDRQTICYLSIRNEEIWLMMWSAESFSKLCLFGWKVGMERPPLWSRDQGSCLQIQRSGFESRRYQIFWEVVGLKRGPLSLVSTIQELLGRKSSGSGLENREYGRRDPPRWPRDTPSIRWSWHKLRRQAAVARSVSFARGLKPRSCYYLLIVK